LTERAITEERKLEALVTEYVLATIEASRKRRQLRLAYYGGDLSWSNALGVPGKVAMVVGIASIVISSLRSADELRVANLKTLALIRCEEASFKGDP
jgi:hypothetical protein